MNLPYCSRLLCLAFACYFLVHLLAAAFANCLLPAAIRFASKVKPRDAARMLFALRLFPFAFSVLLVAGFCVPSYLRLEPEQATEPIGPICIAAALLGLFTCGEAVFRGLRALVESRRYIQRCTRAGQATRIEGDVEPICVLDEAATPIAIAGLIHPTLIASRGVIRMLSAEQLSAALQHERAHWAAHDNLKRLVIRVAPRTLPSTHGFRRIERAWSKFTEWAADDRAVAGDPARSVVLAATLVRVARISSSRQPVPLVSSLLADGEDLSTRVDRLLCVPVQNERPAFAITVFAVGAAGASAAAVSAAIAYPAALRTVHSLLESLIQ
jgi:beta-lactamase regulating signal transducer with metallopeptidase domain